MYEGGNQDRPGSVETARLRRNGLRRAGAARLAVWLRKRKARNANAVAAAHAQHTIVAGQNLAAAMVARLAGEVMNLHTKVGTTETVIEDRLRATATPKSS